MSRFDASEIRRYYDRHTGTFIRFGKGGSEGAIHRAVWGSGTRSRLEAFHYVDDQIAELVRSLPETDNSPHVVDLGCGVAASLCYLAERLPLSGTGVTLSPVQASLARRRIQEAGLNGCVACIEGDYNDLPDLPPADLAYAIESFVHGPTPERFFAECARLIRPHGLLVICDDFRRHTTSARAERTISRFQRGWRVNTLLRPDELQELAGRHGFAHEWSVDLTSELGTRRAGDRAIDLAGVLLGLLPLGTGRFGYLVGGSALQTCLARGWIGYDLTVFRKGFS